VQRNRERESASIQLLPTELGFLSSIQHENILCGHGRPSSAWNGDAANLPRELIEQFLRSKLWR
jgi:hypothetical protein